MNTKAPSFSSNLININETINSWDLTFLEQYLVQKSPSLLYLKEGLREYKRFIILTLVSGDSCVPSKLVDEIWHAHILHSMNYVSFSKALGVEYIHHLPSIANDKSDLQVEYQRMLDRYKLVFGEPAESIYWQTASNDGIADCIPPGSDCRGTCKHNCKSDT